MSISESHTTYTSAWPLAIYVTVSEKTDHLAPVSDFELMVVAHYSLYATVKSELQYHIAFSSYVHLSTGTREIIFSRNEANL